jgi:hypothetical protein
MTTTSGTPIHLVCSACGRHLVATFFQVGEQYFCSQCYSVNLTRQILVTFPPVAQPDYVGDWLAENIRLTEELNQAKQRIAELEALTTWDDERREMLGSLLESYAHVHRQFYFPGVTEFDTEDTDVRDDIKALWGIRNQIGKLIGIPPLPKDEVQS